MHAHLCLVARVFSLHPSFYFVLKSFFHLFLNPAMAPDENSMKDPLCNSSFGSMVSLDYVTPDTGTVEQIPDDPVLEKAEQLVEVPETVSRNGVQQRTVEQIAEGVVDEQGTVRALRKWSLAGG